jgi:hypothetical protein
VGAGVHPLRDVGAQMIAFATVAGAAALTEPQELRTCKTCSREKVLNDFGYAHGKRIHECRVCARERWTRNRRARLEERMCLSCKGRKPFTAFPLAMRGVRRQLGMTCVDCMVAKELEAAKQCRPVGAPRAPAAVEPGRRPYAAGWASTPDFSQFAQQMLFPDRARPRDYKKFTRRSARRSTRCRASWRGATRRCGMRSSTWTRRRSTSCCGRLRAESSSSRPRFPPALAEFIASRLCEEAAVFCAVTGTEPAVLMLDDPDLAS